ncbi:hypothetical protein [Bremerella cremea]|uniref:hypothetical protein n=1 Tax=Bremerella cremea TaxID=1031537 RepID=UPI0031E63189
MNVYEHSLIEELEILEFVMTEADQDEEGWDAMLQAMANATRKTGIRRILLDRSRLGEECPRQPMFAYRTALRTAEVFGASVRIAAQATGNDDDNFWETVASNRGAIVKVGTQRAPLIDWLMQET